jgi:hypothetical protein
MEIWGFLKGLQATKEHRLNLLIAEDDAQIVINLLTHLLNGADLEKISPRWRLLNGLANFGVDLQEGDFFCSPTSSSTHPIVIACRNLAHNKDQPPDGVTSEMTDGCPDGKTLGHISRHLEPMHTTPTSTITPCL